MLFGSSYSFFILNTYIKTVTLSSYFIYSILNAFYLLSCEFFQPLPAERRLALRALHGHGLIPLQHPLRLVVFLMALGHRYK